MTTLPSFETKKEYKVRLVAPFSSWSPEKQKMVSYEGMIGKGRFLGFGVGTSSGKIAAAFAVVFPDGKEISANQTELEFINE